MSGELSHKSAAYKNLSCYGIGITALRVFSFWEHRWVVTVIGPKNMDRETLKRHIEHFLEVEFEASEFVWTQTGAPNPSAKFCRFKSFAL